MKPHRPPQNREVDPKGLRRNMTRNYSELRAKMRPESRARSELLAAEMLAVMDLAELRKARNISQGELAERLDKGQPAVAKKARLGE